MCRINKFVLKKIRRDGRRIGDFFVRFVTRVLLHPPVDVVVGVIFVKYHRVEMKLWQKEAVGGEHLLDVVIFGTGGLVTLFPVDCLPMGSNNSFSK